MRRCPRQSAARPPKSRKSTRCDRVSADHCLQRLGRVTQVAADIWQGHDNDILIKGNDQHRERQQRQRRSTADPSRAAPRSPANTHRITPGLRTQTGLTGSPRSVRSLHRRSWRATHELSPAGTRCMIAQELPRGLDAPDVRAPSFGWSDLRRARSNLGGVPLPAGPPRHSGRHWVHAGRRRVHVRKLRALALIHAGPPRSP